MGPRLSSGPMMVSASAGATRYGRVPRGARLPSPLPRSWVPRRGVMSRFHMDSSRGNDGLMTIKEFSRPGDSAYLAWLDVHPDGYVINTEPGGRGYARLHRAICDTIRNRPPFTGPS